MNMKTQTLKKFLVPACCMVLAIFVLAGTAPAGAAFTPAATTDSDRTTANEPGHPEAEADGRNHEEAKAADEAGVKIDHHGKPIYDEEERVYEKYTEQGVSVQFTMENFLGVGGRGGEVAPRIIEGEHAVLQFRITDAASGAPLAGLKPAVWLDASEGDTSQEACRARVQGYLGGTLNARPMVNLNSYFILGMNKDNTISVIDPMVRVAGMTNLFSVILLQGTPQDWAMTADQRKLLVTLPDLGKVAVVDLDGFQVEAYIAISGRPLRIAIQPDGRYAWVGIESEDRRESSVAVIDIANQSLTARIPTRAGAHSLAFSPDSRHAFVTNGESGTLTIIDSQTLKKVKDLTVGSQPVSAAVAATSGAVYVADRDGGTISVVDGERLEETSRMMADSGLAVVGISPDGKWGFAANPQTQKVYVFETANKRITHAVPVKGAPDQIFFTKTAAYIRSSSTPAVFAIPLEGINPTGNISVLTVPIGNKPPSAAGTSSLADAIAVTPDNSALLISNPADDKIYFYTEGSQSASGAFQGHTLVPRAVQVVDRSLKERSPGVYTGGIRIPRSGDFTVAFLLNEPQIDYCFQFTAKPNPELREAANVLKPELKFLTTEQPKAGEAFNLQLELTNANTGEPIEGVKDLLVLARVLAGNWSQRATATDLGKGVYKIQFTFPKPRMYNLFFTVPSLGLRFDRLPQRTIRVSGN
jgi:YVTN family beta-propeller protein